MHEYIGLLKGVNVGGHRKIKMADLQALLTDAGLFEVTTYIQSGNLVFRSSFTETAEVAQLIAHVILTVFGFEVEVLVFRAEAVQEIFRKNPFLNRPGLDLLHLHVTLLNQLPETSKQEAFMQLHFPPEEIAVSGKTLYLYCPNGYGKTSYSNPFIERKLGVTATTRNWKTIGKLAEMAAGYLENGR